MITKPLIVSLIKDDLIHSRLVNGLNALGLDASPYFLHLSDSVFKLMDIEELPQNDVVYELYLKLSAKAKDIDLIQGDETLDALAQYIYEQLLLLVANKKSPFRDFS